MKEKKITYTEANVAPATKTVTFYQLFFISKSVRKYVRNCDSDAVLVLCECLHNVLLGHVRAKLRDLEKYRHKFEFFSRKNQQWIKDDCFY